MKYALWCLTAVLACSGVVRADETADAAWKKQMENKIDVLTQELEQAKLSPAPGAHDAAVTPSAPLSVAPYSFGPAAGKVYGVEKGLSIGSYGELIYQNFTHAHADSALAGDETKPRSAELNLARWVMYLGYRFSDKILFNSELEVEAANSGKGGEAEVEFAYLDFALSKPFGLRVGELLAPVGLVNEYHEPTVFHGVLRPDVESYLIPTTWHENGAGYYGQYGPFAYRGYVMASLRAASDEDLGQDGFQGDIGLQESRQEGSRSRAHNLAYVQRLDYIGVPGWLLGGSVFTGNAGQGDTTPSGLRIDAPVTLWETHLRGEYKGWEMRALYTQTTIGGVGEINEANGFTGNQSAGQYLWGGYVEVAYNILNILAPSSKQDVSPFFRYERYNTQGTVPDGYESNPANDRRVYTMGLSYKPIPRVVLKTDYQIRNSHGGGGVNQFNLGMGYEF
jgi:hypothetical protein